MALDIEINSDPLGIARGLVEGVEPRRVFGRNPDTGAVFTPVGPTDLAPFQSAASTSTIVSDSANDDSGQPGARTVRCQGLIETGEEVVLDADLEGLTIVETEVELFRLNAAVLPFESVGTYGGTNEGTITIRTAGGDILGVIEPGTGASHNAMITVPKGKTGYMIGANVSADSAQPVSFRLCARIGITKVTDPYNPMIVLDQVDGINGSAPLLTGAFLKVPELTDLWVDAQSQSPGMGSARFDVYVVDNEDAIQSTFT